MMTRTQAGLLILAVFMCGWGMGLGFGLLQVHRTRVQIEAEKVAIQKNLTAARTELDVLKAETQLLEQEQQACMRTLTKNISDSVSARTVLADRSHPDYQSSVTLLGKRIPIGNAGPVWVIPSRVMPVLQNDAPGAVYGYVGTDGQLLDGWHIATKR